MNVFISPCESSYVYHVINGYLLFFVLKRPECFSARHRLFSLGGGWWHKQEKFQSLQQQMRMPRGHSRQMGKMPDSQHNSEMCTDLIPSPLADIIFPSIISPEWVNRNRSGWGIRGCPSPHQTCTFNQFWVNVGTASQTVAQHKPSIGWMYHVCLVRLYNRP